MVRWVPFPSSHPYNPRVQLCRRRVTFMKLPYYTDYRDGEVSGVPFPSSCLLRPVLHRFQAANQLKRFLHRSWQLKSMHAHCTKCNAIRVKISRKVCSTTKLNVLGRNKMRTLDSKQTSPTAYYTRYYQDQNVSFKLRQDLCIFSFAITISTFFIFTQSAKRHNVTIVTLSVNYKTHATTKTYQTKPCIHIHT